jgi:Fic family protein
MHRVQRIYMYIHQLPEWPNFYWQTEEIINLLGKVRNLQGRWMGKVESLGFDLQNEALLETLTQDVVKSSEIEGEHLKLEQVRTSIARQLGLAVAGLSVADRHVDGVVEMMLDATQHCFVPLTAERLFAWHSLLFPSGRSGIYTIKVAQWRSNRSLPMQVVSGTLGKEKVHFEAPSSSVVESEMDVLIAWLNSPLELDLVLKAAVAHLWFLTIHPFEDGNGRIARAITDRLLAQSDNSTQRFYSMSAQIHLERQAYYEILENTQKGSLDITNWMKWFLNCLIAAVKASELSLNSVLNKAAFWSAHANTTFNERQTKLLNRLLNGFEGKLTSAKWAKIAKCSKDTAIRDINDLIDKQILQKEAAGGRSTSYRIIR